MQKGPFGHGLLLPVPPPPQESPALLPTLHTFQSLPVSRAGEIVSFNLGRIKYFW